MDRSKKDDEIFDSLMAGWFKGAKHESYMKLINTERRATFKQFSDWYVGKELGSVEDLYKLIGFYSYDPEGLVYWIDRLKRSSEMYKDREAAFVDAFDLLADYVTKQCEEDDED